MNRLLAASLLLLAACLAPAAKAEEKAFELPDPEGTLHHPLVAGDKKGIIFFFVSPYCPTANSFMPEIGKIADAYGAQFAAYIVHSDPSVKATDAYQQSVMFNVKTTILLDKDQALANKVHARITPEVVVLAPDGKTLYKGRINDLYLGPTKKQKKATTQDLRDALESIQSGKPVAAAHTEAMGCKISGIQ